jgi:hypothetical protein
MRVICCPCRLDAFSCANGSLCSAGTEVFAAAAAAALLLLLLQVLDREEVEDDELDAQDAADEDMEAFIEGDEEEEEEVGCSDVMLCYAMLCYVISPHSTFCFDARLDSASQRIVCS